MPKGPSDRWPRVPYWLGWHSKRQIEERVEFLEKDVKAYHDFLADLLKELIRQREVDRQLPDELVRRVNDLDEHVVAVIGGGTKWEALGVVAFILGIGMTTWASELARWLTG